MQYIILHDKTTWDLEKQVMSHIKNGCVPQGGISQSQTTSYGSNLFCQAMIKKPI